MSDIYKALDIQKAMDASWEKLTRDHGNAFNIDASTYKFWRYAAMSNYNETKASYTVDDYGPINEILADLFNARDFIASWRNRNQFPEETAAIAKRMTGYVARLRNAIKLEADRASKKEE